MRLVWTVCISLAFSSIAHGAPTSHRPEYDVSVEAYEEESRPLKDFPDKGTAQDRETIRILLHDIRHLILREMVHAESRDFSLMLDVARAESLRDKESFKTDAITRKELAEYRKVHSRARWWWDLQKKNILLPILSPILFRYKRR